MGQPVCAGAEMVRSVSRRSVRFCLAILFGLPAIRPWAEAEAADTSLTNNVGGELTLEMRIPKPLSRAEERALKPKDQFKECTGCPEMVVVPTGEFTMGSPDNEELRNEDESPQHQVRFTTRFAVGRFAVTFDEWERSEE